MSRKSKDKNNYNSVGPKVDFPKMEEDLLEYWYKNGIVGKYLEKNSASKKIFSFVDGPITANNPMGVHHAWGRTYKDVFQRYKSMRGFRQRFQNGFDAQGLWVEVEVEKELKFKHKKDIEKYGVGKFVDKCKERVKKYANIQTEQSKRLGYFMDWDNSYVTMSEENNYMIWHFLKVCHDNGWLYKGADSVPWCPRCETAISQHEMLTEDYKEVTHKSVYFKLPIISRKNEFLLVWTTTPWTIPANIAVAVDENIDYSLVEVDSGDKYWMAKEAVSRILGKKGSAVNSVKGRELTGLRYKGPFDELPSVEKVAKENPDKFHIVIATDERILPISSGEGTGLVHTAVSAGSEDFKLGKKLGLPMIPVIADDATYLEGMGFLSGKNAKEDPDLILDYLNGNGGGSSASWVFRIEDYTHRYPACWRCKTELVWKVTDEWYIAMDKPSNSKTKTQKSKLNRTLRQKMKDVAKQINWIPEFGLKRELDWLSNMHDWLISKKNRYWGLALPIWECSKCKNFEVIGSKEELKEKALNGWSKFEGKSPHKPQIDAVKIECGKCGEIMSRIEPVGNPWLDAGIVPFSTISEDNQSATFDGKGVPLYKENKAKWRKWFPADFVTESFPGQFKNWFYSLIAMSSVLEDQRPANTILGFATLLDEDGRPMHKSWGNSIEFNEGASKIGVDVMRWMYLRQDTAQNLLFGINKADQVRRQFHLTLWNVYRFFVTYANLENWKGTESDINTANVLDRWILIRLKNTWEKMSKFLDVYDARRATEEIEQFVNDLSLWYIRRSRERIGQSNENASDKEAFYITTHFVLLNLCKLIAPLNPFISEEIYRNITGEESVHLSDWPEAPDFDVIVQVESKDQLVNEMDLIRNITELGHSERKKHTIPVRQPLSSIKVRAKHKAPSDELIQLIKQELNIKTLVWNYDSKESDVSISLDTNITQSLKEEGKAREFIRSIQLERKNKKLGLDQLIDVKNEWIPKDKELKNIIIKKALIRNLTLGSFSVHPVD